MRLTDKEVAKMRLEHDACGPLSYAEQGFLLDEVEARGAQAAGLVDALRGAKVGHVNFNDEECLALNGGACNCGADSHNRRIDDALARFVGGGA